MVQSCWSSCWGEVCSFTDATLPTCCQHLPHADTCPSLLLLYHHLLLLPQGKLPALPGERPTMSDWENHLTTIFPEVSRRVGVGGGELSGGGWQCLLLCT
jgi:hypothetical protein